MLNVLNPLVQFNDENGNPLSLGRVLFYDAGTENPKNVYTDYAKTLPVAQVDLDAGGFMQSLFFGTGYYKVKIFKKNSSNYDLFAVRDNVEGFGTALTTDQTNRKVRYIEDADLLSTLDAVTLNIEYAYAYTYKTDSLGGGWFKWDANSSATEDLGFYFKYNSQALGRWVRVHDLDFIYPQLFGLNTTDSLAIHNSAIEKALNYCYSNGKSLVIPSAGNGYYYLNTGIDFERAKTLTLDEGARFSYTGAGSIGLLMTCPTEIKGRKKLFNDASKFFGSVINAEIVRPEHFGGLGDDSYDNYYPLYYGSQIAPNARMTFDYDKKYKIIGTGVQAPSITQKLAHFEKGSSIYSYLNSGLVLQDITSDMDATYFIRGTISGIDIQCPAKINWFYTNSMTITTQGLQDVFDCLTYGSKWNTLIWTRGTWNLPTQTNQTYTIQSNFEQGAILKPSGYCCVGSVSAPQTQKIFDSSMVGNILYPAPSVQKIYLSWYGNDINALKKALEGNNANTIDCCGISIVLNADVSFSANKNLVENLIVENSTKTTEIIFGGTPAILRNIKSSGNFKIWGVRSCTEFIGTLSVMNPSNISIQNCQLDGLFLNGSTSNYVISGLFVKNNTINSSISLGANIATYGHRADVYDNYSLSGGNVGQTRYYKRIIATAQTMTNGSCYFASTSDFPRFLPYYDPSIDNGDAIYAGYANIYYLYFSADWTKGATGHIKGRGASVTNASAPDGTNYEVRATIEVVWSSNN